MFSFRGRIGRWDFFKGCIALVGACIIPVLVAFPLIGPIRAGNHAAVAMMVVLLGAVAAAYLWISLALQARRWRDIGLNPVYVIPGWFAVQFLDSLIAYAMPQVGIGHQQHQTPVGVVINLGMLLAMTFWPGTDADSTPPLTRTADIRSTNLPAATQAPLLRPSGGTAKPAFGRRGMAT